ncbi:hypothetical protein DYBT9275_04170 [Dyadobacter sp. CECT 9275]|uniref:Glycosyltransferase 2-like domain-containing protein n=1 Tax=Dyadobacter helix TaxID=2822344 RepID=A0A916NDG0_9BACT|nr:glycosyltransferase family A protein [Dyadobacter sp. CECT 9275]CAG5007988.1 hypothetical protein DYBT9275_04170 [Dyadobacter sp. CECT 9275]
MNPIISAVIPCFNHGAFISECITSLLNQSTEIAEIIVVDDGSTDPLTCAILQKLNSPKTRVIFQSNLGASAARNTGFREAIGTWILTIDADDYFHSTFLEKALQVAQNDSLVGAVSCWVQMFGLKNDLWRCLGGDTSAFLVKNNSSSAGLILKNHWEEINGYDESMMAYEDWDFWLRLTTLGVKVHVIQEALFFYRKHAHSLLASNQDRYLDIRKYMFLKNKHVFDTSYPESLLQFEKEIIKLKLSVRKLSNPTSVIELVRIFTNSIRKYLNQLILSIK